ncbi:hypothetical protein HSX11_20395 [Oxalobacteraceae bacterium]|nr:hypothetical protein [Oxalobacteraceae bacterium]
MPGIDDMGIVNDTQGICGFTSTLYAVYMSRPNLQRKLDRALDASMRDTRMMAEIKTFLVMMKAAGNQTVLDEIAELTKTFPGYGAWSVDWYIGEINKLAVGNFSIAMPPDATMEYMRTAWDLRPTLVTSEQPGDAILGLTRTGAPVNRWNNLAHFVFRSAAGKIYSWGEQFDDLAACNTAKGKDYSVVYRIMVHG